MQEETRLTVMLRKGGMETALEGLARHLGIYSQPTYIYLKEWKGVIPQYGVGHLKRVATLESHLRKEYPYVKCIGNYLKGVALNQCIHSAKQMVQEMVKSSACCDLIT